MIMQNHDGAAALVKMANDIADYFHSEKDRTLAVDGIFNHIVRFWEPRMRRRIVAHFVANGGEDLNELARAAIARLAAT
ncbi:MAG: formate dehydrogenase subunit delta [Rudaea sp.]|uniref:formate dehydrogenase subunit delta n=1 Tax=Rudaea sp. TaxID=2136325 RepID=UPI0039E6C503